MVCDLARLFSDNMAILNYQFGGIFAAFFAFRSNSSHTIVVSRRLAQVSNEFEFVQNLKETSEIQSLVLSVYISA